MTTNYTALESKLIESAIESSAGNGHDFGFVEELAVEGLNRKQVGGLVTSLQQKGFLRVYEPVRTDSGVWTQFVIAEAELEARGLR